MIVTNPDTLKAKYGSAEKIQCEVSMCLRLSSRTIELSERAYEGLNPNQVGLALVQNGLMLMDKFIKGKERRLHLLLARVLDHTHDDGQWVYVQVPIDAHELKRYERAQLYIPYLDLPQITVCLLRLGELQLSQSIKHEPMWHYLDLRVTEILSVTRSILELQIAGQFPRSSQQHI